jgi:hypothetical protein
VLAFFIWDETGSRRKDHMLLFGSLIFSGLKALDLWAQAFRSEKINLCNPRELDQLLGQFSYYTNSMSKSGAIH